MRGKAFSLPRHKKGTGITPAYAGKSVPDVKRVIRKWDHPRLCGEKRKRLANRQLAAGSPPPMRGKVRWRHCVLPSAGITPAYAGKSCTKSDTALATEDHPRLCGEKAGYEGDLEIALGITPAYAGKRP